MMPKEIRLRRMGMRAFVPLLLTSIIACSPTDESGKQPRQTKAKESRMKRPEHAVLIYIKLSDDKMGNEKERKDCQALEERMETSIKTKQAGEFDGDEWGEGFCRLFMYGPDADALFNAVETDLRAAPLLAGSYAIKRYGPAGDTKARETRIVLR
jgi:hypothetical protein